MSEKDAMRPGERHDAARPGSIPAFLSSPSTPIYPALLLPPSSFFLLPSHFPVTGLRTSRPRPAGAWPHGRTAF